MQMILSFFLSIRSVSNFVIRLKRMLRVNKLKLNENKRKLTEIIR